MLAKKVGCQTGMRAASPAACVRCRCFTLLTALPQSPRWCSAMAMPGCRAVAHRRCPATFARAWWPEISTASRPSSVPMRMKAPRLPRSGSSSIPRPTSAPRWPACLPAGGRLPVIAHYGPCAGGTIAGLKIRRLVCLRCPPPGGLASAAGAPTFYYHFTRAFAYHCPILGFPRRGASYIFHTPLEFVTIKADEEDFPLSSRGTGPASRAPARRTACRRWGWRAVASL